jgi:hypothetical protein
MPSDDSQGRLTYETVWEENGLPLYQASLEWPTMGSVEGMQQGKLRLAQ